MSKTYEVKQNETIQQYNPIITPLCQVYSGAVWQRQWSDSENEIHTDYVVSIGVKNKFPDPDKFGFKVDSHSIHRRAFRFDNLEGAMMFGNVHSITMQEEEE